MTPESLRQIAANATNKSFVGPIPDEELGARMFERGLPMSACTTSAQMQGYRKEADRSRRMLMQEWWEDDHSQRRGKR